MPQLSSIERDLAVLGDRYNISVDIPRPSAKRYDKVGFSRRVSYRTLVYEGATPFVGLIRRGLGLYPPEYINSLGLRDIKLAVGLKELSYFHGAPEICGLAFPKKRIMYLSADDGYGSVTFGLHHELSHFSDPGISGLFDRRRWVRLNPAGKKAYQVNGAHVAGQIASTGDRPRGFSSIYGKFSPVEDKAEVSAFLMTTRVPGQLDRILDKDSVLKAKASLVLEGFKKRSRGRMDDNYFRDLAAGKISEEYWD